MLQETVASVILFFGVLAGSTGTARLVADELPKKAITDPNAELEAIAKEWAQAQAKISEAYRKAATEVERQKILAERPSFEPYAERCFQLVNAHPQSPAAMHALVFVVTKSRVKSQAARAIDLLRPRAAEADLQYLRKHLTDAYPYGMADLASLVFGKAKAKPDDPNTPSLVVWVCLAAGDRHSEESRKLLLEAVEYLVRHHGDSSYLWTVLQYVDLSKESDTLWAEQQLRAILAAKTIDIVRRLAAYTLAALLAQQSEASQPEAERWLRECLRVSEEMKATGGNHQLDATEARAQQLLAKIQRFGLGQAAPDIAGQDLDGQVFKLSDYRGKVVLLDFWGFW